MASFILRRIFQTIIVLVIVSFLCFSLIHITPGDPVSMMLGVNALQSQIDFTKHQMGLDKPFFEQYIYWLGNVLHGNFGQSIRYKIPVMQLFTQRFPTTAYLAFWALILSILFGITTGIVSAIRRGTFLDQGLVVLATTGVGIPIFWLGIIGIYVFGLLWHWLPVQGWVMPNVDFWQSTRYAIMPVICLAIPSLAVTARQTRSSMLEVISQDYMRTAWSKGLRERLVVIRHGLKNALIPIVTLIGLQIRILLGGSVIVETVFNIPGMGRTLFDSAWNKDYFIVQGGVLVLGAMVCVINLLVDLSYVWLDPRIRYA